MKLDFNGKNVLITGAQRGIGKEIALGFARSGANVLVNYPFEAERSAAEDTVEQIQAEGVSALMVQADVRSGEEVDQMVETMIKSWGSIDILINNAGITKDKLLIKMSDEEWQSVIDINLGGTFRCSRRVSKEMMSKRYGRIVNISSVMGLQGNAGQSNYAASKGGIISFTKSMAKEFGARNITVNCVAPGYISTAMTTVLPDAIRQSFIQRVLIKREGSPEDIMNAVLFLASDQASYITGQVIVVDGGLTL
ncbi:MAG TPA: 3-oxoacyl-[acyl-carrier-protein] reductase [Caldisericia bacterium]|nr:3-oxoacyl-[acyl-carrier-protein] reductase [Caldisericia bacterium]